MAPAIGYAIREQNRLILDDPAINAVEITFERADNPLRIDRYVRDLDMDYTSVHGLKLSPGSADPPSQQYMDAMKNIAQENGANSISDHLGFTRDAHHGVGMGHFSPVPPSRAALDVTARNVEIICDHMRPFHFYLENVAYLFQLKGEMQEAEFLAELLQRTGCGWLLDVTNVYANATNFGFDGYEFIERVMPSAERVQMHLAGGFYSDNAGMYIDSHSHPIPEPVWSLYRHALRLGHGKVDAVFIERDQNFPDEAGWREEVGKVRRIAEGVDAENAASARVASSGAA